MPECPVCGSRSRYTLYENLKDNVFHCAPGTWMMKRCDECECAYLDPRPTPDTIHLAYETYYTHSSEVEGGFEASADLKRVLVNGYRNYQFGSNLQPASWLGVALFYCLPNLRRRVDSSTRFLPYVAPGSRLLDVGFGNGDYLRLASGLGWDVAGVDADPVTVQNGQARALPVREGGPEAFLDQPSSFDAVTLNHTIEHVHDPRQLLQHVYELLKPGGFLYLETPNIDAFGHRDYGEYWRGIEAPRHLILFSIKALLELLHQTGFERHQMIVRSEEYPIFAAKSRALCEGRDPYSARPRLIDRLRGLAYSMYLPFNNTRTEVITITAHKAV